MLRRALGPLPLLAVAALCLLCVPSVRAALPASVKDCKYSDKSTADKPCEVDLYVGEYMTYECASADTAAPSSANGAGGHYCPTALEDSGNCAKAETLDADVGGTTAAGGKVTLRMREDYTEKFKDVIMYHVRCVKGDGSKIFVSATLWPFTKPLTAAPRKTCTNGGDTGTTYLVRCNFFIFKSDSEQDFDCRDAGAPTTVPADAHSQAGNVCTNGFKSSAAECAGDAKTPWNTVANGVTIAGKNSNQNIGITPTGIKVKRALFYLGCKRDSGTKDLYAKGMIFNEDFVKVDAAHVKMIKHVCTPEKGKALDTPCDVTLGSNEAAVMVCTPFVVSDKYKLMPADTNTKDGKFCTKKPGSFKDDCSETKKWSDDAKVVVSKDATMDFFIVALPKANADQLKSQVVAYGYCSDETKGLAWKVTVGSNGVGTTSSAPGSSAALPDGPSGMVVGMMTLVAASFVAAAAM